MDQSPIHDDQGPSSALFKRDSGTQGQLGRARLMSMGAAGSGQNSSSSRTGTAGAPESKPTIDAVPVPTDGTDAGLRHDSGRDNQDSGTVEPPDASVPTKDAGRPPVQDSGMPPLGDSGPTSLATPGMTCAPCNANACTKHYTCFVYSGEDVCLYQTVGTGTAATSQCPTGTYANPINGSVWAMDPVCHPHDNTALADIPCASWLQMHPHAGY